MARRQGAAGGSAMPAPRARTAKKPASRRGIERGTESKANRNMGSQRFGGAVNRRPDVEGGTAKKGRRKATRTKGDTSGEQYVSRSDNRRSSRGPAGRSVARSGRRSASMKD